MKNRYIKAVLAIVLCLGLTNCSNYLDEDAKGVLTPDNYFQNEAEAELAINGLHADLRGSDRINAHLGTDQGVCGRNPVAPGWLNAIYDYNVDNATVRNTWTADYATIKNANFLIDAIQKAPLSADVIGRIKAQAIFYRAHFYFKLTTTYGDIPYWRNSIEIKEVSLLGKTSAAVINQEMVDDLDQAIKSGLLPTTKWNQNTGRPTVWAARMLKANIHMWLHQWAEAKAELIEVTANSPHKLSNDYAEMYRQGKELHNEIIFGREYLATVQDNRGLEISHYNSTSENPDTRTAMTQAGVFARSAAVTVRKSFADTYDVNDKRKKYNVWENYTLTNGKVAKFNYIYMPKLMRASLPLEDPLMQNPDLIGVSGEPEHTLLLSDAFLLLAEAEFMLNGSSATALAAINKVRSVERTGLQPYTSITIEDIRNERGWELMCEGYFGRKRDLIRWGILESTVIATPAKEIAAGAYVLSIKLAQDEATIIQNAPVGKYQVSPIPIDDILKSQNLGGALVQNPLWD